MAIFLLLSALTVFAQNTPEERALILNQEMDFLLQSAPKARVYAAPNNQAVPAARSGLAPSQMPEGIDNAEDRYFSDEVRFQAAASDKITDGELEEASIPADDENLNYRVDGTPPKRE